LPPAKSVVFAGYAVSALSARPCSFPAGCVPPAKSVVFAGYAVTAHK
jgi:hypothetical protein